MKRIFRKSASIFGLAGASLMVVSPAQAASWDPAADFSISNGNPNGVWTYGYMATDFTGFTPYADDRTTGIGFGWFGDIGGDGTPGVWKNTSSGTAYGVPVGDISLHPGPSGQPSIVRWTAHASVTGDVSIAGQFLLGDGGIMTVGVRQGDVPLWSASDAGSFNLLAHVLPGDTIDFAVYGAYASGNTPLEATISTVPEPATFVLLSLAGMAALRRRRS